MNVELTNHLVNALNSNQINYCHWKSNFSLSETMSGKLDLDLLVDRKDLSEIWIILFNLGFKSAIVKTGKETPSIYHFYGFDHKSGLLVHVHLFSSILTGESFVKSHLLPFEQMLLANVYNISQVKVAPKAAELVLFIVRTYIKFSSLLDLLYLVGKFEDLKTELSWLQEDGDLSESLALLKRYCPVIDVSLFLECVDAIKNNETIFKRTILAQRIRSRLRVYAKHSRFGLTLTYFQILSGQVIRRLNGNKKNKMLHSGGAVIAFVGPEATGKSTLVSESKKWLEQAFATSMIHAGKPPSSWITAPINILLPLVRSMWPRLRMSRMEGHVTLSDKHLALPRVEGLSGLIYALRSVSLAWDRKQLLVKARRLAANGEILICDRYPSETVGAMDSPRLQENMDANGLIGSLYNWLARLEKHFYQQIPPPDLVLQLKVSIETAKKRNRERIKIGKETDEYLESRHLQSQEWHFSGTKYIQSIDTELPLPETILKVKESIWEAI